MKLVNIQPIKNGIFKKKTRIKISQFPIKKENMYNIKVNDKKIMSYVLDKIVCSIHNDKNIILINNRMYCLLCDNKNLIFKINLRIICENDKNYSELFCDTCNIFLCLSCFLFNSHKNHICDSISTQSLVYKNNINEKYQHNNYLLNEFIEKSNYFSIKNKEIFEKYTILKGNYKKIIREIKDKVNILISLFNSSMIFNYKLFTQGITIKRRISNASHRLSTINEYLLNIDNLLSNQSNFINKNIVNYFSLINSLYRNDPSNSDNIYTKIQNLDEEQKYINQIKGEISTTNQSSVSKNLETDCQKFYRKVIDILSTNTFQFRKEYLFLRRFDFFNRNKIMYYFKKTGIWIRSYKKILIKGIRLCCINISIIDKIKISSNETDENTPTLIPIMINIYKEYKKEDSNQTVVIDLIHHTQTHLKHCMNDEDPTFSVFFNEDIVLDGFCNDDYTHDMRNVNGLKYLIEVNNMSNSFNYINLYTGYSMRYNNQSTSQIVLDNFINNDCNFNLIEFSKVEESDFSEINIGIISDIIYSREI